MTTPIEKMLDAVDWSPTGSVENEEGLPFSTHEGVLELFGHSLRCYRLNTGQTVFDADDFEAFYKSEFGDE